MTEDNTKDRLLSVPEMAARLGMVPRTLQRREAELLTVGGEKTPSGWRIPAEKQEELRQLLAERRTDKTDSERTKTPSMHDIMAGQLRARDTRTMSELQKITRDQAQALARLTQKHELTVLRLESSQKTVDEQAETIRELKELVDTSDVWQLRADLRLQNGVNEILRDEIAFLRQQLQQSGETNRELASATSAAALSLNMTHKQLQEAPQEHPAPAQPQPHTESEPVPNSGSFGIIRRVKHAFTQN